MRRVVYLWKPISLAIAMLGGVSAALAQQAVTTPPAPVETDVQAGTLETVTVTAQGRSQQLQQVPIVVKTFSAAQIEKSGIVSTQDFINLTPNVSFDHSFTFSNSFITIRGVSELNNADSPVAVVVDGVPQNNQKQLKMNLFDIQRIEVLKGPQGALFGRNAIGGAITIETRQPTNSPEGFVNVEGGNGGAATVSAGVSGPIVDDKVLFRAVGESERSGGLIDNVFLKQKVDAIRHNDTLRGKVLIIPTEGLRLDLRANANDYSGGATYDSIVPSGKANDIEQPRSNILGRTTGHSADFSVRAEYALAGGTFAATTAYTSLGERYRGDLDFSNPVDNPGGFLGLGFQVGQGQNLGVKIGSQELRFTSDDNLPFRWIFGGLAINTRRDLETRAFIDTDGSRAQFDDRSKVLLDRYEHNNNNAYSVFGQVEQDLFGSATVALGLRYDRDQRHQVDEVGGTADRAGTFSAVQPKVTFTERFTKDVIGYLTYSTGFRSGGFNAPGLGDFRPEKLSNYEVGVKSTLVARTLFLNASAFYANSRDFQYFYTNAATGAQLINNIDRVHIRGVDIDFQWLAFKGLQFDGGIGTTDSKINRNALQPDTVGNYTPKASPFKVNIGAQYSTTLAGLNAYGRLDVEERSRRYWQINNADVQRSLTLLNARVGLSEGHDRWSAHLFVKNLTNRRYYEDFNPAAYSGLGYAIGSLAEPRQFGGGVKFRF